MQIGIVVFDGVDVLDAAGPYEVLLTASRLAVRAGIDPPFEVMTASVDGAPVTAYGGLQLLPQAALNDISDAEGILVPGAIGIERVLDDAELMNALLPAVAGRQFVASVCTGAFLLGAVGLLEGRAYTTHWEDIDLLNEGVDGKAIRDVAWVDSRAVVTSGGLSSGMAMTLHLVDRFADRQLALLAARQLDYVWHPDSGLVTAA